MSDLMRNRPTQPEPDPLDVNISSVVYTLLGHKRLKPTNLAEGMPRLRKTTLYARLKNEGAGWQASEVRDLAEFFNEPVSLFYEDAEALLRSRCFSDLAQVAALPGEPELSAPIRGHLRGLPTDN